MRGESTMDKLNVLRALMNERIAAADDPAYIAYYYDHLYGVSTCAMLLARRRGLDAQLAGAMGLVHDIWTLTTGDAHKHGEKGAPLAHALVLEAGYTIEEADTVADALRHHSDKADLHGPYAELLKDADTLQPWLARGEAGNPDRARRMAQMAAELGLPL